MFVATIQIRSPDGVWHSELNNLSYGFGHDGGPSSFVRRVLRRSRLVSRRTLDRRHRQRRDRVPPARRPARRKAALSGSPHLANSRSLAVRLQAPLLLPNARSFDARSGRLDSPRPTRIPQVRRRPPTHKHRVANRLALLAAPASGPRAPRRHPPSSAACCCASTPGGNVKGCNLGRCPLRPNGRTFERTGFPMTASARSTSRTRKRPVSSTPSGRGSWTGFARAPTGRRVMPRVAMPSRCPTTSR
jgi:hypothetical protein